MTQHTPTSWLLSSSLLVISEKGQLIANCAPLSVIPELDIEIEAAMPTPSSSSGLAMFLTICLKH